MNFDAAIQSYIAESRELLDTMEQSLMALENGGGDDDLIHAIFRAAHTIKGTGGIFGFDPIVHFTHDVESLLDRLRGGLLALDGDIVALLLRSCDHIRSLLEPVTAGEALDADLVEQGRALLGGLARYLGHGDGPERAASADVPVPVEEPTAEPVGGGTASADHWHISLRFGRDVLRNGMDPLSFLRYLAQLGELVDVATLTDALPEAPEMDPESCYLGFEIGLRSGAEREQIEGAFEFVRDDCAIRILPPHSKVSEYIQLIQDLPEDTVRLGEILVGSKALTQVELDWGLKLQVDEERVAAAGGAEHHRLLGEILVEEAVVPAKVVSAALDKQQQIKERKASENRFIRVEAEKLDQLVDLVGELVIAGANTQLLAHQAGAVEVIESAANLFRLVEELRNRALGLQMVQIGSTLQRFQRVVRDVGKELGKQVELYISGGETELDKSVIEQIGDPLMHLVRNALDHGIEPAAERLVKGKPEKARVELNAYHESGSIVIEVTDDGRGLDRDKILAKAVSRGLVGPGQNLPDGEVYNLIFEPGFSTADSISNLSGRGVGMDVVRRNVEALRGHVQLHSQLGSGTTVRIRLPLTLAIIDGFLVGLGPARYVIPMDMLVECLEHSGEDRAKAIREGYLNVRGKVLPILRLSEVLGVETQRVRRESVVVVRFGELTAGLVVDELLGEFQTVIKPLGALFGHLAPIGGSTILGSGEVALIIDVPGLLRRVQQHQHSQHGQTVSRALAATA